MLDKTKYHEVNKDKLTVGLRRFQAFFTEHDQDLASIEKLNQTRWKKAKLWNNRIPSCDIDFNSATESGLDQSI